MQGLDGHFTLKLWIKCKIYDALRTAPQFATNFKSADSFFHWTILLVSQQLGVRCTVIECTPLSGTGLAVGCLTRN